MRLAGQQFFPKVSGNQALELVCSWLALPLSRPGFGKPGYFPFRDPDGALSAADIACVAIQPGVGAEQQCTSQQEMNKRLSQKFHQGHPQPKARHGHCGAP